MNPATVLVMAKAPVAGRVKTRLCPPLLPAQAADLAAAALLDTVSSVAATVDARTVVALDGEVRHARRAGELRAALAEVTVIPQQGNSFSARLVAAHIDAGGDGPVLQIGMDTPQLTPMMLTSAMAVLRAPQVDAVLGPASDGGWWALGLRAAVHARVLRDVPLSRHDTGELTLSALRAIGLRVEILPTLTDVDTFTDAIRVAMIAPGTLFAAGVRKLLTENRLRAAS